MRNLGVGRADEPASGRRTSALRRRASTALLAFATMLSYQAMFAPVVAAADAINCTGESGVNRWLGRSIAGAYLGNSGTAEG
jgi:hypothetical protein